MNTTDKARVMHNHIMLVRLSIGQWEGRIQDKDAARNREREAHAISGAAGATKHLAAGVAEHENLKKATARFRAAWNLRTVPWDEGKGGARAISSAAMMDLMMEVAEWEKEWRRYVQKFLEVWPTVLASRQFDLGAMFKASDFPTPKQMERKFYWQLDNTMIASPDDIRFAKGVDETTADILVEKAVASVAGKFQHAANAAAQKLFTVVQSMHNTMAIPHGQPGGKFNNSKLENILEIVELMPMLNVTGDTTLAKLAAEAKKLATKSPDELRGDEVVRKKAAVEAEALAKKIADAFDVGDEEEVE